MTLAAPSRRGLLLGLGALIATPAIIRIDRLMPVKIIPATLDDLAKLNHFEVELAQAETWQATSSSFIVDGKRFFLRARIGMPRKMNNRDDASLTEKLVTRFVREGLLEAKNEDGEWANQPMKQLIVPKHWLET